MPTAPIASPLTTPRGAAAPVNWIGAPVGVAVTFVPVVVVAATEKFAQVILVLFPKCKVIDRLPKKAPIPSSVEAKSSE